MTGKMHSKRLPKAPTAQFRIVPWAILCLMVIGLTLLATRGPEALLGTLNRALGQATGALDLTILHTNDTYGYVFPCG